MDRYGPKHEDWHLSVNKQSVLLHCVSRSNVYILQKMIHGPSNVKYIIWSLPSTGRFITLGKLAWPDLTNGGHFVRRTKWQPVKFIHFLFSLETKLAACYVSSGLNGALLFQPTQQYKPQYSFYNRNSIIQTALYRNDQTLLSGFAAEYDGGETETHEGFG